MQIKALFLQQDVLDDVILGNYNNVNGIEFSVEHIDLASERFLALFVELGEVVSAEMNKRLDEYIDVFHFILSLRRTLNLNFSFENMDFEKLYVTYTPYLDYVYDSPRKLLDLMVSAAQLANATRCFKYWSRKDSEDITILNELYEKMFIDFIKLGHALGFDCNDVLDGYQKKYEINNKRQVEGY